MAVQVRGRPSPLDVHDSLDELAQLVRTAGLEVAGRDYQRLPSIKAATYMGSGKLDEINLLRQTLGFDVLILDDELSSAQLRNLEEALDIRILDRTALILDIFAMHARTKEGALQVELAQYAYRLPRLTRQWTHLSRQGVGGVGLRGPGERQLEVDRRDITRRMSHLRDDLEQVRKQRGLQRRRRRRRGMPVIAIVGYTNAGKSSLLNRLSGADVLVQDMLFATLDPTTRRVNLPSGKEVLFTDTVGFIQKLPTQLVASFRATLEEVHEADILLHVADIADKNLREKIEAAEEVLAQIDADGKPTVVALNKIDLIDPGTELAPQGNRFAMRRDTVAELRDRYDRVIAISAQQGVGIEDLLQAVEEMLVEQMVQVDALLPYDAGELLNLWHEQGIIDEQIYGADGIRVRGKLPPWMAGMVAAGSKRPFAGPGAQRAAEK